MDCDENNLLVNIGHKDWATKEEIFFDEVSEHLGKVLGKRNDEGKFFGIIHEKPETAELIAVKDDSKFYYSFTILTSRFLDASGKPGTSPEDFYETYCVVAETDDSVITGNFLNDEVAVAWIEGLLG